MNGSVNAHRLWYAQPAAHWHEAMPLGNGRIGAMIFGDACRERIGLNEDTLWSGYPRVSDGEYTEVYRRARELALQGELSRAQKLIEQEFGDFLVQMYLPLGRIYLTMGHSSDVSEYRRELRLDTGIHTVAYNIGEVRYRRECFISVPDQVLAIRLTTDRPGALTFDVQLEGALCCESGQTSEGLWLDGNCPICLVGRGEAPTSTEDLYYSEDDARKGVGYRAELTAYAEGGSLDTDAQGLHVRRADAVTLLFAVRTSFAGAFRHPVTDGIPYREPCTRDLTLAAEKGYEALRRDAVAEHRRLYERTELDLGVSRNSARPTDERLRLLAAGKNDPALYALLFHFGRYLTIAASRPGTQPMNLQGIWNEQRLPPWSSNYTLNINTEMNYWPTLAAGLEECYEPFLRLLQELHEVGRHTAMQYYGAPGFTCHHATDLWRVTHPGSNLLPDSAKWAYFPLAGGWLSHMGMEFYRHTGDRAVLQELWPVVRDAAEFCCEILCACDGELVVCPSTSPENVYLDAANECALDTGTQISTAIVRDVLEDAIEAGELLNADVSAWRKAKAQQAPYRVCADGTLCEWRMEREEAEPHHRHVSHLYGLYPSRQITDEEPALLAACRRSLEKRGDEGTGWSMAWKIGLWARLGDGDHALQLLKRQLRPIAPWTAREEPGGSYCSLLCAHPPFQIDGNMGACSGILEMLVRAEKDGVRLLPALPHEWQSGALYGYHLPGGQVLDMRWKNGYVTEKRIVPEIDKGEQ